jgi:tetratricopeptide (TPR) repeat protein
MLRTLLAFILVISAAPHRLCATEDSSQKLAAARSHWLHGRYEEAAAGYEELVADAKIGPAAAIGLSRCQEAVGKWPEAAATLARALDGEPENPELLARSAELRLARGELVKARDTCQRAIAREPNQLLARWIDAQAADASGDHEAARRGYEWFVQFFNRNEIKDPESLLIVGLASMEHAGRTLRGRDQSEHLGAVLNSVLDAAAEADKDFWPAPYCSGRLFLEKYKKGDAQKDLRRALAINPNAAVVHVALGVAAFHDYEIEDGHQHADRALAINPNLPAARQLKADLFMARDQFSEAMTELERAKEINPIDEETLARIAACHLYGRRVDEFDRLVEAVQSRNPRPIVFYSRLAERLEDHRRFDIAEGYFQKAMAAAPDRAGPRTGLGMLYMRVGKESDAATTLEAAFEMDPFNVRTKNMLEVLDQLKGYQTIETAHFHIKVDEKLDGILGHYAAKYLEEVYAELTELFAFEPPERIQIEILNKGRGQSAHQWFSARTVGLPWIGTVGACTGKVVAMASPRGVEKPFNWARVLKHEVSHVITLQQTNFQIPHWYTEALAVRCEDYPRPQIWNQLLLERVPAGNLFNLDNINLAFARPKSALDWQMAYCQSELYAEYIQSRFGGDSTARLLDAYRAGLSTTEAVEKTFGVTKSDFESGYVEHLKKVASGLRSGPVETPMTFAELERAVAANPNDPDMAARLAGEHIKRRNYPKARELALRATQLKKHHPLGSYMLARLSMLVGDTDRAGELLEPALDRENPDARVLELLADLKIRSEQFSEARSLYELGRKFYPADSKWVAGLARVALKTDNREALREGLELLSQLDADDPAARKKLASMALEDKNWDAAARYAAMTLHIDVADVEAHTILGEALTAQQKWRDAADEYKWMRQLRPNDRSVLLKLAQALHRAGDAAAATAAVKELLEKEPENAEARELLKQFESK